MGVVAHATDRSDAFTLEDATDTARVLQLLKRAELPGGEVACSRRPHGVDHPEVCEIRDGEYRVEARGLLVEELVVGLGAWLLWDVLGPGCLKFERSNAFGWSPSGRWWPWTVEAAERYQHLGTHQKIPSASVVT